MDDERGKLEEVFQDKASEVSQFQELPAKTAKRAKRRVGRNVASSILVAGLVLIGVSWGISNLRTTPTTVPGGLPGTGTPPPMTTSCAMTDLIAAGNLQGAAGSVEGGINVTNTGTTSCTLTGRPTVTLETAGAPVAVTTVDGAPWWKKNGSTPPAGWPVVTLDPGASATVSIRWSNPCPQINGDVVWKIGDSSGSIVVDPNTTTLVPPCNGPGEASTLELGPFEPALNGQ